MNWPFRVTFAGALMVLCRITICLAGSLAVAQAASPPSLITVTDDRGLRVEFVRSPQRIVSLLPSLTETVCALGQCQRLVGVDRYSNFPKSVRALPKVGGGLDPNIEAIVALKPDVVVMATSSRAGERLQALGIKVVALEPKTYAEVRRVVNDPAVSVSWAARDVRPAAPAARLDTEALSALQTAIAQNYDTVLLPTMSTGATDMAYLREKGIQCYGTGPAVDVEDGPKGFGSHSDQERLLEDELHRFVRFSWDAVVNLARAR